MNFQWRRCCAHPSLVLSVIVTPDAQPWCIGLPDVVNGHPVDAHELERGI